MDYYDEPRSSNRLHYDETLYDSVEDAEEPFYSTTEVIYSFPKCKCCTTLLLIKLIKSIFICICIVMIASDRSFVKQQYGWHKYGWHKE